MSADNFKTKKDENEVLQHSISIVPNFTYAAKEFYTAVEKALSDRRIPGLDISRVEYAEGGLLSHNRIYLRMMRERLMFETCAAPFGIDYFFSCRTIYRPAEIKLWHVVVVLSFFGGLYLLLERYLGPNLAAVAVVTLPIALAQVFRNAIALGLADLDKVLLNTPAIGPIYERFFRKETYYRKDTRLAYLEIVPKLIEEIIAEITAANGAKLIRSYEHAPIFGELYKRVR